MLKVICLIVASLCIVQTAKLPTSIKPCPYNDSACAVGVAQAAFAELINGYKPFKMPPIEGFKFDKFDLSTGEGLNLFLKNGEIRNLKTLKFKEFNVDSTNKWNVKANFDVELFGDYEISGRILILSVQGEGKAKIKLDDIAINYIVEPEIIEKNGKKYFAIKNSNIEMKPGKMHVQLDNLFNGDKALGDQFNQFVNENWEEVEKEFHAGIIELIKTVVEVNVKAVFQHVPVDQLVS